MPIGNELLQSVHIVDEPQLTPHGINRMYAKKKLKSKAEFFENKPLQGYVHKKVSANKNIDQKLTRDWTTNKFVTSHFEAYTCAITKQKIGSKNLYTGEKNYIRNHQQQITNVDYVRKKQKMLPIF